MIEAVIFDFDGIIVDTEPIHCRAFQKAFEPLGAKFSYEEYLKRYVGFDDRDGVKAIAKDAGLDLDQNRQRELIQIKEVAFEEIVAEGVYPYPGVLPLIEAISKAGMKLAISSGASKHDIDLILPKLGIDNLRDRFETIVTADDVAQSKPDPESYMLAAMRLKLATSKCIAIEDTIAGMTSATDAGMKVLGVTNTYPADDLAEHADWIVETLEIVKVADLKGLR